jgi:archaellum component FlaG (FlaF/FlaG flagellin family)
MLAQIDFESGLQDAWHNVATIVPKLLAFFVILLIGWFIAKALSKLTNRLLERVGFDGWVERGSLREAFARNHTDASDIVAVLVFWIVFLVALQLAFGIWGPNPISDLLTGLIAYIPRIVVAVLILVIAGAIAKVLTDVLRPMLGAVEGGDWIARAAGVAVLVIGVFAALDELQIAPAIVVGLFYALLAVIVGALIVAFGGGGIPIAREYLQRWRARGEVKAAEIRSNADIDAAREQIEELRPDTP